MHSDIFDWRLVSVHLTTSILRHNSISTKSEWTVLSSSIDHLKAFKMIFCTKFLSHCCKGLQGRSKAVAVLQRVGWTESFSVLSSIGQTAVWWALSQTRMCWVSYSASLCPSQVCYLYTPKPVSGTNKQDTTAYTCCLIYTEEHTHTCTLLGRLESAL